ncbi:MAG: hypothetical protein JW958_13335 [Candidatus Eisenbacteria bacterium]|nr:hypothetical protein [Candidatus Eisenbacteria bacterium]
MRVHRDGEGRKITRVALAAGVVLFAIFLMGAGAERARLASHKAAWASLERETRLLADWIAEWDEPSDTEEEAWVAVRVAYEGAVPAGETRLSFSSALNELADEVDLDGFSLVERPPTPLFEETRAISGDVEEDEDGGGDGWEDPWEEDAVPAGVRADRSRYSYEVRFAASYRSLVRFLDGLERMPRIVEIRAAEIRRGDPRLDVEMEIATYGRDPDAL